MINFNTLNKKHYDLIIPIGTDCASATVLDKQKKRKIKNSLLDITVTCSSLDYKFDVLIKPFEPLKIENLSERFLNHITPDRLIYDKSRDCIIRHRFSQDKHVLDELEFFNNKFKQESMLMLKLLKNSKNVLLFFTYSRTMPLTQESINFNNEIIKTIPNHISKLINVYPKINFDVLIVDYDLKLKDNEYDLKINDNIYHYKTFDYKIHEHNFLKQKLVDEKRAFITRCDMPIYDNLFKNIYLK